MKIGIDGRLWNQTGIGRYLRNICVNLSKIDDKNDYFLFIRNEDKKDVENEIKNNNWRIVSSNVGWHSIKGQINFPRVIEKEKVDLMHFPYFDIPFFYRKPYVITIHDLVYHHFMTGKSSNNPIWLYGFKMVAYKILINNAARHAKKIIAVSNTTKDEIFDHLMVNKQNVEVIYEAADDFKIEKKKNPEIGKYFLYVGNVYPHKNVGNLIKAFKSVSEGRELKLVFIGKDDFFYKRLKNDFSKLISNGKVIIKENLTDKELAGYYSHAICLIQPSLMEGFSLPPLEAMTCGTLVLASNIPVHKEIFGNSILYFDSKDVVDIERQMNYVLNLSKGAREEKIKEGKILSKRLSWEEAARKTLKVYESSARL